MSDNPYQTPGVSMEGAMDAEAARGGSFNTGLVVVHGLFCLLYLGIGAAVFFFGPRGGTFGIGFMIYFAVLAGAHLFGAFGANQGSTAGRWVTRVLGVLMLLGFPLGTLIGIFMLMRTGDSKWESPENPYGGNW